MKPLSSKFALVTGGGQGIGQGISYALADSGATVAVTGRTLSKCETTVAEIEKRGGKAVAFELNVMDAESAERGVASVVETLGGINILINNAATVTCMGTLMEVTYESFEESLQGSVLQTFRMMKLCYPLLKGDGCIVNFGSSASRRWDMSGYGPYGATKDAVRVITRAAANEWGPDNIRVNAILPHAISPSMETWIADNPVEAEHFFSTIPLRRVGDCEEDIGKFVAMMCTPAAKYLSAQTIGLDGGQAII